MTEDKKQKDPHDSRSNRKQLNNMEVRRATETIKGSKRKQPE